MENRDQTGHTWHDFFLTHCFGTRRTVRTAAQLVTSRVTSRTISNHPDEYILSGDYPRVQLLHLRFLSYFTKTARLSGATHAQMIWLAGKKKGGLLA